MTEKRSLFPIPGNAFAQQAYRESLLAMSSSRDQQLEARTMERSASASPEKQPTHSEFSPISFLMSIPSCFPPESYKA